MDLHDPAHPGAGLKESLSDLSVTSAAKRLGVSRLSLSKVLMRSPFRLTLGICGITFALAATGAEPSVPCTGIRGATIDYAAVQSGSKTYLFARSTMPTSGWTVSFEMRPEVTDPSQYTLLCEKPSGVVAQVVTHYTASVVLSGAKVGSTLVVYDGLGKHEVPVWIVMPPI